MYRIPGMHQCNIFNIIPRVLKCSDSKCGETKEITSPHKTRPPRLLSCNSRSQSGLCVECGIVHCQYLYKVYLFYAPWNIMSSSNPMHPHKRQSNKHISATTKSYKQTTTRSEQP